MEILALLWCYSQSAQEQFHRTFKESDSSIKTADVNPESDFENAGCPVSVTASPERKSKRSAEWSRYETVKA